MAWLAMHVHMGRQRKGGVDVTVLKGEEEAPPPPPPGSGKPSPPPKGTPMRPPPHPPPQKAQRTPPRRSGRQGTGRGGRWWSGWSSSISYNGRRGINIHIHRYMYMQVPPANPPRHGLFERHVGYPPPPRKIARFFSARSVFYLFSHVLILRLHC